MVEVQKDLKVKLELHKKLMQLKIDLSAKTVNDVLETLLKLNDARIAEAKNGI